MKQKRRFHSSTLQIRILAVVFVVVLLLQIASAFTVYSLITNDLKSKHAVDVEDTLDSLVISFSSQFFGEEGESSYSQNPNYSALRSQLKNVATAYDIVYPKYEDKLDELKPGTPLMEEYFGKINSERINAQGLSMSRYGDTQTQLQSLFLALCTPSSNKYLYVGYVDKKTGNFVVVIGTFDVRQYGKESQNNDVYDVVQAGYFFPWKTYSAQVYKEIAGAENEGFIGYECYDPIKENIYVSARRFHFVDDGDRDNDPNSYWIITETDMSFFTEQTRRFSLTFLYTSIIGFAVLFVGLYFAIHFLFLKRVKKLSSTAEEAVEKLKRGEASKTFALANVRFPDEIDHLNDGIAYFEKELLAYTKEREETIQKEEKNRAEMAYSAQIQLSSLPNAPIADSNITIYPRIKLAKDVGGDLYDYFYIDSHRFLFLIGDVSGKGVPAALFMMQSIAKIKATLTRHGSLHLGSEIKAINDEISAHNPLSLFITFFIGLVDTKANTLSYVNCGHEEAFFRHDGVFKMLEGPSNLPLGAVEGFDFEMVSLPLCPGDTIYLYTDGVSEAENIRGEFFGKENIEKSLNAMASLPNQIIVDTMLGKVERFQSGKEQSDDICMLSLTFHPSQAIELKNKLEELDRAQDFIEDALSQINSPEAVTLIKLAMDEMLTNVISYAFPKDKEYSFHFELSFDMKQKKVYGCIIDKGVPFNPLEKEPNQNIEDVPGGLGILIAKDSLDEIHYERVEDHNVLSFVKNF